MGVVEAIVAVAAIAAAGSSVYSATQKPKAPKLAPTPAPPGPPADVEFGQLQNIGKPFGTAPSFLTSGSGFSSSMTPFQQRRAIATYGTQSDASRFRSKDAAKLFAGFLDQGTPLADIEKQYLGQGLGLTPNDPASDLSWYNALDRWLAG